MSAGGGNQPDINVTPLIDVLLVLLIIFMVVAPLKPAQFETKVPQKNPNPNPPETNNDLLMVVLKTNNTIEFPARQQVSPDELSAKLASALADRPEADRTVIIAAPEKLPYTNIVNVIDVIKGAGATTIGLQIDSLEAVTQS